jgi:capsular exopolysaccharide synthesis family protein
MRQGALTQLDIPTSGDDLGPLSGRSEESYVFDGSLVTLSDPFNAPAEAIRALRTHIMAQHVNEGRRALAVCAASAGVGCTFVAANLAVALSQIGVKTLLIDGDLRNSGLDSVIRPPSPRAGLRQCLSSSDHDFGAYVEADVLPNLSIMYSGGVASQPQELLASDQFTGLMDYCLRDFDATIVDTPPANSCSDARRISTVAGYSIIVARRNKSLVNDVRTLARQLAGDHARVVGTILNEA